MLGIISLYDKHLEELGFKSEQAAADGGATVGERMNHIRWMCREIMCCEMPSFESAEKTNRWLGYIQGQLQACGVFTLADLKEHNSRLL